MTIPMAILFAALAADAAPANPPAPAPPAPPAPPVRPATTTARTPARLPGAPKASLPTVEGEIVEIDHGAHRLRLRTAEGELLLGFDRNTLVLGPSGAVTPLLLTPGVRVRAGRVGSAAVAWVELKAPPSTPTAAP